MPVSGQNGEQFTASQRKIRPFSSADQRRRRVGLVNTSICRKPVFASSFTMSITTARCLTPHRHAHNPAGYGRRVSEPLTKEHVQTRRQPRYFPTSLSESLRGGDREHCVSHMNRSDPIAAPLSFRDLNTPDCSGKLRLIVKANLHPTIIAVQKEWQLDTTRPMVEHKSSRR